MRDLGERLAADTLALIDIASESRDEVAILEVIRERVAAAPGLQIVDDHDAVLAALPVARREGVPLVVLAGHAVTLSPAERTAHDGLVEAHRRAGASPPNLPDALAEVGLAGDKARRIVHLLVSAGELVRLREGLLLHREALAALLASMASWYAAGQTFSVPDFKERSGVSRKHAIPLLELLDTLGCTRRVGDGRLWMGRAPGSPEAAPAADEVSS